MPPIISCMAKGIWACTEISILITEMICSLWQNQRIILFSDKIRIWPLQMGWVGYHLQTDQKQTVSQIYATSFILSPWNLALSTWPSAHCTPLTNGSSNFAGALWMAEDHWNQVRYSTKKLLLCSNIPSLVFLCKRYSYCCKNLNASDNGCLLILNVGRINAW